MFANARQFAEDGRIIAPVDGSSSELEEEWEDEDGVRSTLPTDEEVEVELKLEATRAMLALAAAESSTLIDGRPAAEAQPMAPSAHAVAAIAQPTRASE